MPEMIEVPSRDGKKFNAYVVMPEAFPAPVVIVIQEIFGINEEMRQKCSDYAAQGYIAVCPDLFWRIQPGIELTDKTEEEWEKAFELFKKFDVDKGVDDLKATMHTFRGHAKSTGKIGCVGYCLGGKLSYLLACRSAIDAAVGYYGVDIDTFIDESSNIENKLMLHIAEEDEYVSKAAQKTIKSRLKNKPEVIIHSYPGVDHAFARSEGAHFDKNAAQKANRETASFFKEHLKG